LKKKEWERMRMIDAGNGSFINSERIISIAPPDSMPVRRLIQDARDAGMVIDVTCGRKTASVIVTDSDHVILSADAPQQLTERMCADDR